jgi:hypothetical protein
MIAVTPAAETTRRMNCSAPSTKLRSVLANSCVGDLGSVSMRIRAWPGEFEIETQSQRPNQDCQPPDAHTAF